MAQQAAVNGHSGQQAAAQPPPPGQTIEAEIFSVGTWNGDDFTEADLHEMVENFYALQGELKPPLKFGHDDGQGLLGQSDGDPALGWVEGLRVAGDKLIATFGGVPDIVLAAIRARRYRRVSAEIYFNVKRKGEELGKVLKAVALLGADLPAVTNLADLAAYLTEQSLARGEIVAGRRAVFTAIENDPQGGATDMADNERAEPAEKFRQRLEQLEQVKQALIDENAELKAELARLAAEKEAHDQHETAAKLKAFRAEVTAVLDGAVKERRMLPAQRERLFKVLGVADDEGLMRIDLEELKRLAGAAPPHDFSGQQGLDGSPDPQAAGKNPSELLAQKATTYSVEKDVPYHKAAQLVLMADPALAQALKNYSAGFGGMEAGGTP